MPWAPLGRSLSLNLARRPALLASGSACFGVHASLRYARRSRDFPSIALSTAASIAGLERHDAAAAASAGVFCEATLRKLERAKSPRNRRRGQNEKWEVGAVKCVRVAAARRPSRPASSAYRRPGSSAPVGFRQPEIRLPGLRCCCDETQSRQTCRPGCDGS